MLTQVSKFVEELFYSVSYSKFDDVTSIEGSC